MKTKFIFSLILGLVLVSGRSDLSSLEKQIESQQFFLKNELLKGLLNNTELSIIKDTQITVYPVFTINYIKLKNKINAKDLIIDSISNCYILNYNSKNIYITNYYFNDRLQAYFRNNASWQNIIEIAKKTSEHLFLLNFMPSDLYENPIVGFIKDGNVKFIDKNKKEFENITSLLNYRFGTLETYKKQCQRFLFEGTYMSNVKSYDDAKNIFRNNKNNYIIYNIYDTIALSKAIIFEIEEFSDLLTCQRQALFRNLCKVIKENEFGKKNTSNSFIFNNIVKSEIKKVLFFEQYSKYLANEELFNQLCTKAHNIVYKYYDDEFKKKGNINYNDSLLREKYLKEIFCYTPTIVD